MKTEYEKMLGGTKPFPEPLLAYLNVSDINAGDAVYIGDTVYDSQCAKNAGVDFRLAAWRNAAAQGIPANYLFKTPADVLFSLSEKNDRNLKKRRVIATRGKGSFLLTDKTAGGD